MIAAVKLTGFAVNPDSIAPFGKGSDFPSTLKIVPVAFVLDCHPGR